MKRYNFDEIIDRRGTNCIKYDALERYFGTSDVLPLWVADMDFRTPDFIVDAIRKRAEHEVFGYTFRPDSYYRSIIEWMKRRHNWDIKKEWISFSPGVVAALSFAIEAFTKPGDGVIVQPPVYFPFFDVVKDTNRTLIENKLIVNNGRYTFDFEDLKSKITPSTRMLLLCNPQNPGGMVWSRNELEKLTEICTKNNIFIVSDEIHSDLVFKGHSHIPVSTLSEEVAKNCMICMAPSKTFNTAGFSTSMVIIPNRENLLKYETVLNVGHIGMGNIFGTIALEAAFTYGDEWLNQLQNYLWDNYVFLDRFIRNNLPKVKVMKPDATYLIWLDFNEYGLTDKELIDLATEKAKVALNNGSRFGAGGEGWLRINIGCPKAVLKQALQQLASTFGSI
jgi:cystathionine beta-lyase